MEIRLRPLEEAARPRPEPSPESPHPRRNLPQDPYFEDDFGRDPDPFVDTRPRRPNLEDREERALRSIKLEAPTFDGSLDPRVYEDWESAMEQYFDWYSMSDRTKFKFAKLRLVHQARLFWNSVENYIEQKGQLPITAWGEMREKLRRKYLPASYTQKLLDQWQTLSQGSKSVADYIAKFDEYVMRCKVVESPEVTLSRFRAGLHPDI